MLPCLSVRLYITLNYAGIQLILGSRQVITTELNYKLGSSILSVVSPQMFLYAKMNPSHCLKDAASGVKSLFSSAITKARELCSGPDSGWNGSKLLLFLICRDGWSTSHNLAMLRREQCGSKGELLFCFLSAHSLHLLTAPLVSASWGIDFTVKSLCKGNE